MKDPRGHLRRVVEHTISLPEEQWPQFDSIFSSSELKTGDYFISAGEESSDVAFIHQGLCRFFYSNDEGKEFNKSFCAEGGFIGAYGAFLLNQPSYLNIQALEDCVLLQTTFAKLITLYSQHECWNTLGRIMAEQLYLKKEQREADFLLNSASVRYQNFLKEYAQLEARLPQYHIASYLGITPVALSRIRRSANTD